MSRSPLPSMRRYDRDTSKLCPALRGKEILKQRNKPISSTPVHLRPNNKKSTTSGPHTALWVQENYQFPATPACHPSTSVVRFEVWPWSEGQPYLYPPDGFVGPPMAPDRIAVIDRSARRALQMCDIVLSETISTKAFVTIFKEPKYLSAISGIFDGVRDLLIKILRRVSLIEDSSACLETFMVITEVTALPRKERLVASVNSLAHKLALYPLFFTTDGAEDVAALHDVQYNDPGDPDKTRARALIHELVHYVSYHRYYHFRDQISSPCAPHFLDNVTDRMANDIQPIDFALDSSDEDWNFVGWFGGSVAYGRLRVERLAQLHHGARASLLNADSYALFAVDCMERYFRRQKGMARKLEQLRRQRHLMMTKAWDMSSLMEATTLIEASMPTRAEAATPTSPRSSELTPQTASTSTTTQKSRTPTTPGKRKVIYRLRITRSQARNAKEAGMHPRSKVWIGRLRKRMVNPT